MFNMSELTDKELQLIKQLREKVRGVWTDEYLLSDGNLYNWLQYKNWKLDKAETAIHKNIKWREENKIDGILHEKFDDFYDSIKYYTDGVDLHGRIVVTTWTGQVDTKTALDHYLADKDKGDRHQIRQTELMFDLVKKAHAESNGKVNSCILILDCKGLKLAPFMGKLIERKAMLTNFLVPRSGAQAKQIERNYPGLMERTYAINAPNKLNTLFTLIKPFLKSDTTKKIKIFGKKDEKWRDVILKEVAPDQLRERFGGTLPDEI